MNQEIQKIKFGIQQLKDATEREKLKSQVSGCPQVPFWRSHQLTEAVLLPSRSRFCWLSEIEIDLPVPWF